MQSKRKTYYSLILVPLAFLSVYISKASIINDKNPKDSSYIFITIFDSANNSTMPFVNIIVLCNEEQICLGTTDIDGEVVLQLASGYINKQITIKALFAGYKDRQTTFTLSAIKNDIRLRMFSTAKVIRDYIIYVRSPLAVPGQYTIHKGDTPLW
ncbi:MAG TPA: hypothetical protein VNY36_02005 [Bacteroidia bacterium]|jgi:hypothetical protein|nr:hypothetical protein [Bacteroidia bacterium]